MFRGIQYGILVLLLLCVSCVKQQQSSTTNSQLSTFSADSAYAYIEAQVAFGPRVPGTLEHSLCGDWLVAQLQRHGAQVQQQTGTMINYAGQQQPIRNITALIEGSSLLAILLCAHWDCRPWSDEEEDYDQRFQPVLGANDGASGVGVILEIVRQLASLKAQGQAIPTVQVVFFDCEDMGTPTHYTGQERPDTWCLGSQLWAKEYKLSTLNSQLSTLNIQYGILLDMVGDPLATFPREYFSMQYAQGYVEKLWRTAARLGYGRYFVRNTTYYPITDDHYYINTIAGIPCLDVIDYKADTNTGFSSWWHTQRDDMQNINLQTLQAVGQTVITAICSR